MRPGTVASVALLALLAMADAFGGEPERPTVPALVEGREGRLGGWSLAGAAAPTGADDVLEVDVLWHVVRGPAALPSYRSEHRRLFEVEADGTSRLVGVVLDTPRRPPRAPKGDAPSPEEDAPPAPGTRRLKPPTGARRGLFPEDEPLDGIPRLTDAEVAGLRAVQVRTWTPAAAAFLVRVNPATTCVWIQEGLGDALPLLPEGLRYLIATGPIPSDLSGLARLTSLRFLVLRGRVESSLDLRPFTALGELRVLELPGGPLHHVESLAGLRTLRRLNLSRSEGFTDLSWLRPLTELRRLDVSHTPVSDLSPTGELAHLEALDAHLAPVRTLPAGSATALRSLRLGQPVASAEAIAAFRRLHPACEIVPGRKAALLAAIAGTDRVRVRTGGVCHREPEMEIVRAELTTAAAIGELVALLEPDDCGGDSGCMCCGGPTFEFLAGEKLLASVSLHHTWMLRWDADAWPGDVSLSQGAHRDLAAWLARHGEPEPLEEIEAGSRREVRELRRDARHLALLGAERLALAKADLAGSSGARDAAALLEELEPDLDRRILLALRLRGAAEKDEVNGLARAARDSLFADPLPDVIRICRAAPDEEAARGFALWLLAHRGTDLLGPTELDELVPNAALRLLSGPDPSMRSVAIRGLSEVKRPFSVDLLHRVLEGRRWEWKAGQGILGAAGAAGAAGEAVELTVPETLGNRAEAAQALAELGDATSIERMREVARALYGHERRRLLEKIEELEHPPQPK